MRTIIKKIKVNENIQITKDAEETLLTISNNSIRILINYMEKFKLMNQEITKEKVEKLCTNINFHDFTLYINFCKNNNLQKSFKNYNEYL